MFYESSIEYAKGDEDIKTIWTKLWRGISGYASLEGSFNFEVDEAEQQMQKLIQRLEDPSTKLGSWYEIFVQRVESEIEQKRYIRELVERLLEGCESIEPEGYIERLLEGTNTAQGIEQKRNQVTALNQLSKEFPEEEKRGIFYRIEQLEQLLCILKKNMRGELQLEDIELLEKNVPDWKKQIKTIKACLEQVG